MFWENAVGYLRKQWMLELSNLCHCVQHPWKLTSRDFWSSRNESKPLSKQRYVLRKYCGVSQKWLMLKLSNLCLCVHHPWKLTSRDFWSSRNESKPLSKQKCVLRKCCGVSQKWWMLELSNLCHCVQHPWKLTSRDFWSSRNESKPLSKQKICFEKILWGISEMVNARAFKPLPFVFSTPENWLVGISGALGMKVSHFLSRRCVLRKYCGVSQKWLMLEPSNLCHCVHHPWKAD